MVLRADTMPGFLIKSQEADEMRLYDKLEEFLRSFPTGPPDGISFEIFDALVKTWSVLRGATPYPRIMVALSGGSDGDITLDMLERIGHPYSEIHYVFYDTKMEFAATRRHLDFLEQKYGIQIERRDAKVSVPLGVKRYGVPFLNKRASDYLFRLERHGFQWEDEPLERLVQTYPDCRSALRWWCNDWGEKSRINIRRHRWSKEFLMEHPPDFPITDKCCSGAKKASALEAEREIAPDLTILGLRKAEGGGRAMVCRSYFDYVSEDYA